MHAHQDDSVAAVHFMHPRRPPTQVATATRRGEMDRLYDFGPATGYP